MSATEILAAAKALPLEERIEIAQGLWEDITSNGYDPDLTPEQTAEIERRLADFEKNPGAGILLEQVKAELRQRFHFDDRLSPEQIAELDRRAEDALKNPGRGKLVDQVFAEIEERLRAKK